MTFLAPVGWLCLALILFAIPGWGVLSWLFPPWERQTFVEKIALAIGFSLALYPLLYLYTDLLGLHLGILYPILLVILGISLLSWQAYRRKRQENVFDAKTIRLKANRGLLPYLIVFGKEHLPELALFAVLALAAFTRFWPVRNLEIPMWGDSYQHSLITQLLLDNGGLFQNWQPYAELQTFTYHFGLHTLAASFQQFTGIPAYQATLWLGQILNLFALLALYPLAVKTGASRWAGVAAVAVAGFFSIMPMFYTNWGRYTQLAGQVILPTAIYLIMTVLDSGSLNWKPTVVIWFVLAGLGLTHYLVLLFAGLFYVAYLLMELRTHQTGLHIKQFAWQALGAGLLFLPWMGRLFQGKLPSIFNNQVAASVEKAANAVTSPTPFGDLQTYMPAFLWILFIFALSWGLWRRNRMVALLGLWWLFILFAANPHWFGLPGVDSISNFAVMIAIYIPVGTIIGGSAGWLVTDLKSYQSRWENSAALPIENNTKSRRWIISLMWVLIVILAIGASLWGARLRLHDIQPAKYALVTTQDLQAIDWMQENMTSKPRILVNSFFAYGGSLIAGSDAGWWLPLLAGMETTLPPLNYGMEKGPFPEYVQWINELTAEIQARGVNDAQVLEMLEERGVTHVFIGQQDGMVNQPTPLLDAATLNHSPYYKPIYNLEQVWVFEIIYP